MAAHPLSAPDNQARSNVVEIAPPARSKRQPELDAMRGIFLLWMTLTHLPTPASKYANQPLGFISAAEGFVFLSAMLTGKLHARMAVEQPFAMLRNALFVRARRVYFYHGALLLFAFTVAAALAVWANAPDLHNLLDLYFARPGLAVLGAALLVYCPPLLDILPMYVFYLLLSPYVLRTARRFGWTAVLLGSAAVWALSQFGLRAHLYGWLSVALGRHIPVHELGAFDMWAWQFLWIGGLYLGVQVAEQRPVDDRLPRWVLWLAWATVVACLCLRHGFPTWALWNGRYAVLENKWDLAPIRLLNFAAWTLILASGMTLLKKIVSWRPLAAIGMSSIQVFSAHAVCVLLALSLVHSPDHLLHGWQAWSVILATYAVMVATGLVSTSHRLEARKERKAEVRGKVLPAPAARRL